EQSSRRAVCAPRKAASFFVRLRSRTNVAQLRAIDLYRSGRCVNRLTLKTRCVTLTLLHLMPLLDKLERRFGFLGIPGLIRIVVGLNALVFMLVRLNPDFGSALDLDPARISHGEIWRLVTYIFLPQTSSFLWILLLLWFLWFIGEGLEQAWGSFR